jgi:hypothetical protein
VEPKRGEDIPTVEDLPGVIGSEEEYARILRKPLQPLQEEKVEEPPEVSESEVKKMAGFFVWLSVQVRQKSLLFLLTF